MSIQNSDKDLLALQVGSVPGANGSTSISAAGTTTLTGTGQVNSNAITAGAGSGAYVASIVLSDTGAVKDWLFELSVSMPASSNPKINIYDGSTGGTLLDTQIGNGTAGTTTLSFFYNGTAWAKYPKGALLKNQNLSDLANAPMAGSILNVPTAVGYSTRIACIGDSITYGNYTTSFRNTYPSQLSNFSFCANSNILNFGEPSQTIATMLADYTHAAVTTTVTTTSGSASATLGTISGVTTGWAIGSANTAINTTFTIVSGTSITLSKVATATGTVPCSVAGDAGYNYSYIPTPSVGSGSAVATPPYIWTSGSPNNVSYKGTPHIASPSISGFSSGIVFIYAGTNDYVSWGSNNQTGTIASGNATITSIANTGSMTVGDFISDSSGFIPYGATIVSIVANTSVTVDSGHLPTGSGSAIGLGTAHPNSITASETAYTNLVNAALADGYTVIVSTLFPNYNTTQATSSNLRLILNNWLYANYGGTTFGGASVAGVTLLDLGTAPEFQKSNPIYLNYYSDLLHPSDLGYLTMARYINKCLIQNYPALTAINFGGFSIPDGWLSANVPYGISGQYNFVTTSGTAPVINIIDTSSRTNAIAIMAVEPNLPTSFYNYIGVGLTATGAYNQALLGFRNNGGSGSSSNQVIIQLGTTGTGWFMDGLGNVSQGGNLGIYTAGKGFVSIKTSSAVSFTLNQGLNVFTGSTASQTATLPAIASTAGEVVIVRNQSSVALTIACNSGSQILKSGAISGFAVANFSLPSGADSVFWSDGIYWNQFGNGLVITYGTGVATALANPVNGNSGIAVYNSSGNLVATASGNGLAGTATNDSASAGVVGEYISSKIPAGSAISITQGTFANITSISLTAGDWDVEGVASFNYSSGISVTGGSASLSATSATMSSDGQEGYNDINGNIGSGSSSISLTNKRFSLASTSTIYLVGGPGGAASGTFTGFGAITARRAR